MKLCRAKKHFYDNQLYADCPYCEDNRASITPAVRTERRDAIAPVPKTEIRTPIATPKTQLATPIATASPQAPRTTIIGVPTNQDGVLPVVGWLVIIDGAGKGKDFRLIQGENRIGRSTEMEVCLDFGAASDETVSRDTHARVVYDHHAHEFFVERGNSRNLPLLNGATVRGEPVLQAHDVLQVGQTKLVFVPLCGAMFRW